MGKLESLHAKQKEIILGTCNTIGCKDCDLKWEGGCASSELQDQILDIDMAEFDEFNTKKIISELKVDDRVVVHDGLFGAGIIQAKNSGLYTVKCDNKLPNEYAWETDTSLFFAKDLKLEQGVNDMSELTKRQLKTIKMIGRWADGSCTHSKAKVTGTQLVNLGLAEYKVDAIVLTVSGKEIYQGVNKS